MSDIYKNDFEIFLQHTDEKPVLLAKLKSIFNEFGVQSVLDIGAGNGALSIPLSKLVNKYVAVEKRPEFVKTLKEGGIETIEGIFPVPIEQKFDLVLSSHSISYKEDSFKPFVMQSWDAVESRSTFLIITYRGQEDDWTNLMKQILHDPINYNRVGYETLVELLESLGKVKIEKVITTVSSDSLEEMIMALSFVASNGLPERKERFLEQKGVLEKTLKEKYFQKGKYVFPFQHFFIYTTKE